MNDGTLRFIASYNISKFMWKKTTNRLLKFSTKIASKKCSLCQISDLSPTMHTQN